MEPKEEPEVEVINPETEVEDTPSSVTVDLDKPAGKQEEPKKEEPKPAINPEITKLNNTVAYYARQNEKTLREIAELKSQLSSRPQVVQKEPPAQDEIDEIAQRDWKQGVKRVVQPEISKAVEDILKKRDEAAAQAELHRKSETELEKSKQKVFQKYPDIEVEGSEEGRIYREVLNEDNSLFQNIHGPEIAMYRMEEKLRQMGRVPATARPVIDREVNRLARAGASNVIGRQSSPNGKITLSREQKEMCDKYKIPYEQYAKNLKAQDAVGGVEA